MSRIYYLKDYDQIVKGDASKQNITNWSSAMPKEYYLSEHDENVKGGVLWWVIIIVVVLAVSILADGNYFKTTLNESVAKTNSEIMLLK